MSQRTRKLWEKLGLDRPELRAWAMYDWANSAMVTTIVASIFPVFYKTVACADLPPETSSSHFAYLTGLSLLIIGLMSPVLGSIADYSSSHKKMLGIFLGIGVTCTAAMFWIEKNDHNFASALFLLANIGLCGSFVFYDSLLPHIAKENEIDRVSSAGYALGYLGGGIQLGLSILIIQKPQWVGLPGHDDPRFDGTLSVRLSFLLVAIWWLAFSIPLFRTVREPERRLESDEHPDQSAVKIAFSRLGETFRELRKFKQAFLMLLAFLLYSDGIGTIIRMAPVYGKDIGIEQGTLFAAILVVQFAGIPFAFLFGGLAEKAGAKLMIFLTLAVYCGISVLAYFMKSALEFWIVALLVAMVQGGSQALSRSLFASMTPKHKSAEFFGFFSVMDKIAGLLGPVLFGATLQITGSSRPAILSVLVFFLAGGILLSFVNVEEGQKAAKAADQETRMA